MKDLSVDNVSTSFIFSKNQKIIIDTVKGTIIQSKGNTVTRLTGILREGLKPKVDIHTIKGTFESPQSLQPNDFGMNLSFTTYFNQNGNDIGKSLVSFVPQMNPDADQNHPAPSSNLNILVNSGNGQGEYANDYRVWRLQSNGAFESKIIHCKEQNTEKINNINPKNGMIIYNSDTHKFQGYANGIWVDLH